MKPVRTPEANMTLTLDGGGRDSDLPACRAMLVDKSRGQTKEDAQPGYITVWQPDDEEARRLEAGACVQLTIWGRQHPPVAVGVTEAVVPERELIDRGHVDRALGLLYATLGERARAAIVQAQRDGVTVDQLVDTGGDANPEAVGLPEAGAFVDLWIACVDQTRAREHGGPGAAPEAPSDASPGPDRHVASMVNETGPDDDLSAPDFTAGLRALLGEGVEIDIDTIPGTGSMMLRSKAHGADVMAQGSTRRQLLDGLRKAVEKAAVESEHRETER